MRNAESEIAITIFHSAPPHIKTIFKNMAKETRVKAHIFITMEQRTYPANNQQLNNKSNIHFQDL